GLELGRLHAVLAGDLLYHQLRVAEDADLGGLELGGQLQGADEAVVFGDVVGGVAEEVAGFVDDEGGVVRFDDDADAGGPGVAARAAVDVNQEVHGGSVASAAARRPLTAEAGGDHDLTK